MSMFHNNLNFQMCDIILDFGGGLIHLLVNRRLYDTQMVVELQKCVVDF
jgi:hypothetical protein